MGGIIKHTTRQGSWQFGYGKSQLMAACKRKFGLGSHSSMDQTRADKKPKQNYENNPITSSYDGDNGTNNHDTSRYNRFNGRGVDDRDYGFNGGVRDKDEGLINGGFTERLSIDDMLSKWVGEFGRAQMLHFALTSLAWTLEALHTLVTIFADKTPTWRCAHSSNHHRLQHNYANTDHGFVLNYNHLGLNLTMLSSHLESNLSSSAMCTPSSSLCSLAPSLWEWAQKDESTISQWNLICRSGYLQGFAQSAFFIGCLLGAGLFGHLSDSRLGRRGALALACALNAVCGMLTAASPNYSVYTLLRAATGICSGGLGITSFVLGTESIGPSRRTSAAMSALYFYPLGMLFLAGLASASSSYGWRYLYLITSAPSVLYCLFILPFLAESPRWYLVRGRTQEALQVLKSIAKRNGTVVPSGIVLFMEDDEDSDHEHHADNIKTTRTPNVHVQAVASKLELKAINKFPHDPCPHGELEMKEVLVDTGGSNTTSQQGIVDVMDVTMSRIVSLETSEDRAPLKPAPRQDDAGKHQEIEVKEMTGCHAGENGEKAGKSHCKAASGTLVDVFKGRDTRIRMIILVIVWFACALGYYAFNLNVGNLGTNLTMSVVLNALAEIPGYTVATFLLHRVGQRITVISALLLSGFSSLVGAIVSYQLIPHSTSSLTSHYATYTQNKVPAYNMTSIHPHRITFHSLPSSSQAHAYDITSKAQQVRSTVQLACSLIGLFSIAGTYNLLYLYTAELFPTVVRNVALGLANQAAAIGSIIAPIVVFSAHINTTLPFFIIGGVALLSGAMAIKLPGTLNHPFHETLEGMRKASDPA